MARAFVASSLTASVRGREPYPPGVTWAADAAVPAQHMAVD